MSMMSPQTGSRVGVLRSTMVAASLAGLAGLVYYVVTLSGNTKEETLVQAVSSDSLQPDSETAGQSLPEQGAPGTDNHALPDGPQTPSQAPLLGLTPPSGAVSWFSPEVLAVVRRLEPEPPQGIIWEQHCETPEIGQDHQQELSGASMVNSIKSRLGAHEEFPLKAHVVQWEMAFGLPDAGVLLWAEWLGTRPSTYRIVLQDSRKPRSSWISADRAPEEILGEGLPWQEAVQRLKAQRDILAKELGQPDYRRVLLTSSTDEAADVTGSASGAVPNPSQGSIGAELLGARLLWYSEDSTSCLRHNSDVMVCVCRSVPVPP